MDAPKTPQKFGFEALTICSENDKKHQNSCLMTTNPFLPPISSPSFSHISDYIGTESCGDLIKNYQDVNDHVLTSESTYHRKRDKQFKLKKKEYPPPMTPLPFVLKRNSTTDGRLILTKERVERREYLEAHRSNGRLTLELVSLNDDDDEEEEEKEAERVLENNVFQQRGDVVGESSGVGVENENDNDNDNVAVEEFGHVDVEETVPSKYYCEIPFEKETEGIGGNYSNMRSSSYVFDLTSLPYSAIQKGKAQLL